MLLVKTDVYISPFAEKQLKKVPLYIRQALQSWIEEVEFIGLQEVRKNKGHHDEPLKGDRKGQRSIRLNRAYRAIYRLEDGVVQIVIIEEISKHKY